MNKSKRTLPQKIEQDAEDFIRTMVDSFYEDGSSLYRNLSGRDYGVDGIVELFDNGIPTGKIAFIQIKGTEKPIEKLKRTPDFISCKISTSNACYVFQHNIPVILIYVNTKEKKDFYFIELQQVINEINIKKLETQKDITVRIPIKNCVTTMEKVFEIINKYYNH